MLTKELIQNSEQTEWNFSNKILYEMCSRYFSHERVDEIVGKVLMIGRVYSAAIERRKNKIESNDQFYIEKVAPKFRDSELDFHLQKLQSESKQTEDNIAGLLETHLYLIKLIKELTEQEKRSFSSKYLHFHLPQLFFIYDTRAVKAIRVLGIKMSREQKERLKEGGKDIEYAKFFYKCVNLKKKIKADWNLDLTNRHLDNILMAVIEQDEKAST